MLSKKQIGTLKKGNISTDTDKTKTRVLEDYKSATPEQKKAMLELSGFSDNAYYLVGKRGTASPKHIAAMAQIMKVSPYYYIGESDDKVFTDDMMEGFFKKHTEKKAAATKATEKKPAVKKVASKPSASKLKAINVAPKTETKKPVAKAKSLKAKPKAKSVNKKAAPTKAVKPTPVKKPRAVKNQVAEATVPSKNDSLLATIQLENSAKMDKAVKDLSEDNAVILLKALSYKAKAGGNAETLYDLVKRCLLS